MTRLPKRFGVVDDGWLFRTKQDDVRPVAVGPRCVRLADGSLVCSFMLQSRLGCNDFIPVIARSIDRGRTWSDPIPVWPKLAEEYSIFCSLGCGRPGELLLFGTRTPINTAGELFWREETSGMKQNELVWTRSFDDGLNWTLPFVIPMPIPGSAEAPAPICVTQSGRMVAAYSPYNTFDVSEAVQRNQVITMLSDDHGQRWKHVNMLVFAEADSGGAEAWVIELSDGRLLGTAWHTGTSPYPNAYAISHDGGDSWTPTGSTGIMGQTTALMPLPEGVSLFVYVSRSKDTLPGIWLAAIVPTDSDFEVFAHSCIWQASPKQVKNSSDNHQWTDFSFGEPSLTRISDEMCLLTFWYLTTDAAGIRRLHIRYA